MVDASLGLSVEDFAVLDALYRAGASAMILISKADLFSEAERAQLIEYVTRQVKNELTILPPVFAISVVGAFSMLCDSWFKDHLQPMLASHHRLAAAATERKIAVLLNALIATLETRLVKRSVIGERPEKEELANAFREVEMAFEKILHKSYELGRGISGEAPAILKVTVDQIALGWLNRSRAEPCEILAAKVTEILAQSIAEIEKDYDRIRKQASSALETAEKAFPHALSVELPKAAGMPPLDPAVLTRKLKLKRPAVTIALIWPLLKWQLDHEIRRQIFFDLNDFLDLYAKQLRSWLRESVDELKKAFESAADIYRVRLQGGEISPRNRAFWLP